MNHDKIRVVNFNPLSLSDCQDFLINQGHIDETTIFKKVNSKFLSPQTVREILASRGYQYPHQVISFQMLKGGVAKTTSAFQLGVRAAQYGARVLFVDLDQQANLSFALGHENEEASVWVDIVEKKISIEKATLKISDNIDLIPSSLNNSVLDRVLLSSQRNWVNAVKGPLKEIKSFYDLVIIDTAPHLSAINSAVTCASDQIILPMNPDRFSLIGLQKHREDLADLRSEFDLHFRERILITRFDQREKVSLEILKLCKENYAGLLLNTVIRTSADIKNSLFNNKNLFSSKSSAKIDYDSLAREILDLKVSPVVPSNLEL